MGKFMRRLLMGAAIVWGAKSLQDKRREWSGRSSDEIREEVLSKLPAGMDEESKQKVADRVVQTVKGEDAGSRPTEPAATTTPPPETPMSTSTESATPPPPPAGQEDTV